jgi:hypothetical protein
MTILRSGIAAMETLIAMGVPARIDMLGREDRRGPVTL